MRKKVLLNFPNCSYICLNQLSKISVELEGFRYKSESPENTGSSIMVYHPKKTKSWVLFTFCPVAIITVEEKEGSSGIVFCVSGKQTRSNRYLYYFQYSLFALGELVFIVGSILITNRDVGNITTLPLKTILTGMVPCLFPLIYLAIIIFWQRIEMDIAIKGFAIKFKEIIEKIIAPGNNEVSGVIESQASANRNLDENTDSSDYVPSNIK